LTTIKFHNDTLYAQERDGAVFVAIKPICEGLGIDWEAQRKRIQRDQVLAEGASIMEVPSKGGLQETVTLRLDMVNGWLFGIGANQVKPEARPKVLASPTISRSGTATCSTRLITY
jgi:hypothetical protein